MRLALAMMPRLRIAITALANMIMPVAIEIAMLQALNVDCVIVHLAAPPYPVRAKITRARTISAWSLTQHACNISWRSREVYGLLFLVDVCFMSQAAPGSTNEDFVIASDSWCVVLDGATELAGVDSGCCHGVSWYVSRLGLSLADLLTTDPVGSLPDILGQSISHVSELHEATCDLSNPDSPSSVVLILRERQNHIDYLALSDSVIVLDDRDDGLRIILDDRTAHLPSHTIEAVRALRNSDDGFWVASTLPEASKHALDWVSPKIFDPQRHLAYRRGVSTRR